MDDHSLARWEERWLEPPCEEYEESDCIEETDERSEYDTDIEV